MFCLWCPLAASTPCLHPLSVFVCASVPSIMFGSCFHNTGGGAAESLEAFDADASHCVGYTGGGGDATYNVTTVTTTYDED